VIRRGIACTLDARAIRLRAHMPNDSRRSRTHSSHSNTRIPRALKSFALTALTVLAAAGASSVSACSSDEPSVAADDAGVPETAPSIDAPTPPPPPDASTCARTEAGAPPTLECTGLYEDFSAKRVAADVIEYKPAFELWSDGAEKTRWIRLPPGTTIDVSDMNDWTFPVGTRVWKEFRLRGDGGTRRIETRYMEKLDDVRWLRTTYAWSDDESQTTELADGQRDVPGTDGYEIPSQMMCQRCHGGRRDTVLGFEAVSLAAPGASGLTYAELRARGLLSNNGSAVPEPAKLQVPGAGATYDALGYLHANCGTTCHNANGGGARFSLRVDFDSVAGSTPAAVTGTTAFREAINQESSWQPAPPDGGAAPRAYRIRPLDPTRSSVVVRMAERDGRSQMPPIGSHKVDDAALSTIRSWIALMNQPTYPAAAP
jgi:hypothetical protein